jgi:hypothetical protein
MGRALPEIKSAGAGSILREIKSKALASDSTFDIFLSHSYSDAEVVLMIYRSLLSFGHSVFVDWIEASELNRSNVTRETADTLREAIRRCSSLLYVETPNAEASKWMPWELGFADALHGRVAIFPVAEEENAVEVYAGREYLGLYPYVTINRRYADKEIFLLVNESVEIFTTLEEWIGGGAYKRLGLFNAELRRAWGYF